MATDPRRRSRIIMFGSLFLIVALNTINTFVASSNTQAVSLDSLDIDVDDYIVVDFNNEYDPNYHYIVYQVYNVDSDSVRFLVGNRAYIAPAAAQSAIDAGEVRHDDYFGVLATFARSDLHKIKVSHSQ